MILQALDGYYHRLAAHARPPVPIFGYSYEKISFALALKQDGSLLDVVDLRRQRRKLEATSLAVPQSFKRPGITPRSFFLWDSADFVLGVARDPKEQAKAVQKHGAYRQLHEELISNSDDAGLRAVLAFLRGWVPDLFVSVCKNADVLGSNFIFILDGEQRFIHDRPAARDIWARHLARKAGAVGLCLVTGDIAAIQRVHPPIRGLRANGKSADTIVCYNKTAFTSFGKEQGLNAPVSEQAAFAYTTALNHLLRPGESNRQRLGIGDASTVFWAEARSSANEPAAEAAEDLFATMLAPPSEEILDAQAAAKLHDVLDKVAAGRPLKEIDPKLDPDTRFFVLGLAPNAARLSVRFWQVDNFGDLLARLRDHWRDLEIEPRPWKIAPEPWRLVRETAARGKSENVPPNLAGEVMRAILGGGRYPETLFTSVVMRCRADRDLNGLRAAILKACLVRSDRKAERKESVPVSLDLEESNPGYRLGRLFAVLEGIQRSALGNVNASIRDRFYGAASATPGSVFPILMRTAGHHLSSVRKSDKAKLAGWFEREIGEIIDGIGTSFPRNLPMGDQGRFAIGYYHQCYGRRSNAPAEVAADLAGDVIPDDED